MFSAGGRLQMNTNDGTGFCARGMNAVQTKLFVPNLPPYSMRMRLRTALPSIITASGSAAENTRWGGRSTGRTP